MTKNKMVVGGGLFDVGHYVDVPKTGNDLGTAFTDGAFSQLVQTLKKIPLVGHVALVVSPRQNDSKEGLGHEKLFRSSLLVAFIIALFDSRVYVGEKLSLKLKRIVHLFSTGLRTAKIFLSAPFKIFVETIKVWIRAHPKLFATSVGVSFVVGVALRYVMKSNSKGNPEATQSRILDRSVGVTKEKLLTLYKPRETIDTQPYPTLYPPTPSPSSSNNERLHRAANTALPL